MAKRKLVISAKGTVARNTVQVGSAIYTPGGPEKGKEYVPIMVRFTNPNKGPAEYTLMLH